jgi:uncharacterized RDD family membrane protein YckC
MADPDQRRTTERDDEPAPAPRDVPRMYGAEQDWFAIRLGRAALRPARAAARSGRTALSEEAERAVDAVIAGPVPEAAVRSAIRHRLVERLVTTAVETATDGGSLDEQELEALLKRVLQSPVLERVTSEAVNSRFAETLVAQIVESAAFRRALGDVLSSPELRSALARQTSGVGAEVAGGLRRRAGDLDGSVDRKVARRHATAARAPFGGFVARGIALVVDIALAHLAFLVVGASVSLIASLVGNSWPDVLGQALVGGGWFIVVTCYFVGFWSAGGQTPGMRLMRLRVLANRGSPPGVGRSFVRLVGLILAIIPFGAGLLPALFDSRRRALQDFLAGTVVVLDPESGLFLD